MRWRAFTLVELLVVVAIIVILIAILIPALEGANRAALKAKCLASERNMTQSSLTYASDNMTALPASEMNGMTTYAFDYRATNALPNPLGLGLLIPANLLPTTQLGKVIHCPLYDSSGAPVANHGMNAITPYGVGGDYWVTDSTSRVIGTYNYRGPSNIRKEMRGMKTSNFKSKMVLISDGLDPRFGIKWGHKDEYNRTFSDGSGAAYADPDRNIENYMATLGYGSADGVGSWPSDEQVYDIMAKTDRWAK